MIIYRGRSTNWRYTVCQYSHLIAVWCGFADRFVYAWDCSFLYGAFISCNWFAYGWNLQTEKNELRDEKLKLKAEKEKLEEQVKALSLPSGFSVHPLPVPASFAATSPLLSSKLVPLFRYPGIPMWQFIPAYCNWYFRRSCSPSSSCLSSGPSHLTNCLCWLPTNFLMFSFY